MLRRGSDGRTLLITPVVWHRSHINIWSIFRHLKPEYLFRGVSGKNLTAATSVQCTAVTIGLSCSAFEIWPQDGRLTTDGPTSASNAYLVQCRPAISEFYLVRIEMAYETLSRIFATKLLKNKERNCVEKNDANKWCKEQQTSPCCNLANDPRAIVRIFWKFYYDICSRFPVILLTNKVSIHTHRRPKTILTAVTK